MEDSISQKSEKVAENTPVINHTAEQNARSSETTLNALFRNYGENFRPEEVDWGRPEGKEFW